MRNEHSKDYCGNTTFYEKTGNVMKLAWICYPFELVQPIILFYEPDEMLYQMVVPIVYTEIEKPVIYCQITDND